ncbi:ankyrin repeat domain-containing protein [Chelonobacter oris]|uniref:ankyrin repeat domain-containing protein n=1 Tax=Chelonobacter oris TaxID=505317 RepID=UPI002449C480|nr:ankyrin repeat domain-containing protein [Chelonobacter oris]
MEFYIKHGVDVNAQDMYGMTPLHYALRARNAEGAIALLNAGAGGSAVKLQSAVNVAKMQTRDIAVRTQYNLINQFREQFNNSKIHPREMKLSVNGKIFYADKKLSEGTPIFSGLSNKQIEQLFKDISGINKLPTGKTILGTKTLNGDMGIVYPVKPTDGLLKGATVNLRNFSTSQNESGEKWTIEIISKDKNIFKNKTEIKFK